MSKLEEALKKAKSNRGLQLVKTDAQQDRETTGVQMVPVDTQNGATNQIQRRAYSAREISMMNEGESKSKQDLSMMRIIHSDMNDEGIRDTFRDIRTRILQKSRGKNCIIMVTAPGKGSGTSFISMNLAAAFSFDESKTSLLIDCNLNDPGLSVLLGKYQESGLTDFLESEEIEVASIIHPIGVKRLRFIPAGERKEVAGEYFTSMKIQELFTDITMRYPERFLIVDSPPVLESADSHIMSELCDYILMVVPYGKYTPSQITKAVDAIGKQKLIGIIFNKEPGITKSYLKNMLRNIFKKIINKQR